MLLRAKDVPTRYPQHETQSEIIGLFSIQYNACLMHVPCGWHLTLAYTRFQPQRNIVYKAAPAALNDPFVLCRYLILAGYHCGADTYMNVKRILFERCVTYVLPHSQQSSVYAKFELSEA